MLARNGRGWVEQLPSVRRKGGENSSLGGAAHFFLGGIRANQKSANVAVRAPTGMTPLR